MLISQSREAGRLHEHVRWKLLACLAAAQSRAAPVSDLALQELRVRAACSRGHHFHRSLVSPQLLDSQGLCSVVSVQGPQATTSRLPVALGWSALLFPLTIAAPSTHHADACLVSDVACRCLCTAATPVHLSRSVRAWNAAFPFARLQVSASATCCAGSVQQLSRRSRRDAPESALDT